MTGITLIIALVSQFSPANFADAYRSIVASLTPTEVVISFDGESNIKAGATVLLNGQIAGQVVANDSTSKSTNVTVRIAGNLDNNNQYVAVVSSPMSVTRSDREPVVELLKFDRPAGSPNGRSLTELKGYSSYEKFWLAGQSLSASTRNKKL
jgi:hypothetical protein